MNNENITGRYSADQLRSHSAHWASSGHDATAAMLLQAAEAEDRAALAGEPAAEVVRDPKDNGLYIRFIESAAGHALKAGDQLYATASSAEPAQPVEAVDENLIAAWATSVGAEVDGGDAPDHGSNSPGYGATITFDLAQLAAFVRLAYSTRSDGSTSEPVFLHGLLLVKNDSGFWLHHPNGNDYNGPFETREEATKIAALAHPRPTGDAVAELIEAARDVERRAGPDRELRLRAALAGLSSTVEQAGEVVGESKFFETIWKEATYLGVIDRKVAQFVWHSAMGYARAYAQPRPMGVPDGLIAAARGLLADYEEDHGEGACDCMPEPENAGHCCNACLVRAFTACAVCEGRGGWFFAHSSHDQEWVECTECAPTPAKAGGA